MLTVCNYHYIRENFKTKYPSIFGVTPLQFENQLKLLKNVGDYIKPEDLVTNLDHVLSSKDKFVLITFDDGLKEQFDFGFTILKSLEIPAVFFVNSKNSEEKKVSTVHKIHLLRSVLDPEVFLNQIVNDTICTLTEDELIRAKEIYIYDDVSSANLKFLLNFKMDFLTQEMIIGKIFDSHFVESDILEELYMSERNIIDLGREGFLGSHTHSHFPVGLLNDDDAFYELNTSKLFLEQLTNTEINMVAYPYGTSEACTARTAEIAKNTGYKVGFTTKRGINTSGVNNLLMNRFDCNDLPGGKKYKL